MNFKYFTTYSLEYLDSKYTYTHFESLLDALLALQINRIRLGEEVFESERLYYINLISQKFLLHAESIKKLVSGIELTSKSVNVNHEILDPFSIYSLTRVLIETYLVINYISNRDLEQDTLDCRYYIWMRYGLSKRGIIPESDEEKVIDKNDKESIKKLDELIISNNCFKRLSEKKQQRFFKCISQEWKIDFKDDVFITQSWKNLLLQTGVKKETNEHIYNFLSWHAHSQSISILQLKNMWDNNTDKDSVLLAVKKCNMVISFLISDLAKCEEGYLNSFYKNEERHRELINFYNISFRSEKYAF